MRRSRSPPPHRREHPDCVKVLDLEGRLIYLTPKSQELLGICDLDRLHPAAVDRPVAGTLEGHGRCRRRGGEGRRARRVPGLLRGARRHAEMVGRRRHANCRGRTATVSALLAISRDVTGQKEAVDALHDAQAKMAEIRNQLGARRPPHHARHADRVDCTRTDAAPHRDDDQRACGAAARRAAGARHRSTDGGPGRHRPRRSAGGRHHRALPLACSGVAARRRNCAT